MFLSKNNKDETYIFSLQIGHFGLLKLENSMLIKKISRASENTSLDKEKAKKN